MYNQVKSFMQRKSYDCEKIWAMLSQYYLPAIWYKSVTKLFPPIETVLAYPPVFA